MNFLRRIMLLAAGCGMLAVGVITLIGAIRSGFVVKLLARLSNFFINANFFQLCGIALLLLVAGVLMLYLGIYRKPEPQLGSIGAVGGNSVSIGLPAVVDAVKKSAKGVEGVKDVQTELKVKNDALLVHLTVSQMPEVAASVPELAAKVQDAVRQQLEQQLGIKVDKVEVMFSDLGK